MAANDVELVVAAFQAGRRVGLSDEERYVAVRRALLVHASGGDPHRDPALDDPAVLSLARDVATPERRAALLDAMPEPMRTDPDRAWRAFACGLLADALGEE